MSIESSKVRPEQNIDKLTITAFLEAAEAACGFQMLR